MSPGIKKEQARSQEKELAAIMRTVFISSTVLLTILWGLGFGLLTAYVVVLSFFRILMPKPKPPAPTASPLHDVGEYPVPST